MNEEFDNELDDEFGIEVYKSHTDYALDALNTILERIAYEVANEPDKKPEYYGEMASTAAMLADYINQIENGAAPIEEETENEDDIEVIEFIPEEA